MHENFQYGSILESSYFEGWEGNLNVKYIDITFKIMRLDFHETTANG
jgi:hypothetical protein